MSLPPNPPTEENNLTTWLYRAFAADAKETQKELRKINTNLTSIDKRVMVLERNADDNDKERLVIAIDALTKNLSKKGISVAPQSKVISLKDVNWMQLAKAVTFFILTIAGTIAGVNFLGIFK